MGNEQGTYDRRRSVRCGCVLRLGGPRCFHCLLDGVWEMTDRIIIRARELAIENRRPGLVVERAVLNGAFDRGTYVKDWLTQAEREVLANREEVIEE